MEKISNVSWRDACEVHTIEEAKPGFEEVQRRYLRTESGQWYTWGKFRNGVEYYSRIYNREAIDYL